MNAEDAPPGGAADSSTDKASGKAKGKKSKKKATKKANQVKRTPQLLVGAIVMTRKRNSHELVERQKEYFLTGSRRSCETPVSFLCQRSPRAALGRYVLYLCPPSWSMCCRSVVPFVRHRSVVDVYVKVPTLTFSAVYPIGLTPNCNVKILGKNDVFIVSLAHPLLTIAPPQYFNRFAVLSPHPPHSSPCCVRLLPVPGPHSRG